MRSSGGAVLFFVRLNVPETPRRIGAAGFTLVEMVIVLVILAILVSLAYPAYIDQVRKARRADAESSLLQSAQLLERCFTRFNAYNADGCPDPSGASLDGHYQISVVRDEFTYTVTASPQGDQASDACGAFTIDHLGNKTPLPDGNRCWGLLAGSS